MQTNYNNLSIFNAPALNSSFGASTEIKSTSNSGTTLKRKTRVGARNRNFVPSRNLHTSQTLFAEINKDSDHSSENHNTDVNNELLDDTLGKGGWGLDHALTEADTEIAPLEYDTQGMHEQRILNKLDNERIAGYIVRNSKKNKKRKVNLAYRGKDHPYAVYGEEPLASKGVQKSISSSSNPFYDEIKRSASPASKPHNVFLTIADLIDPQEYASKMHKFLPVGDHYIGLIKIKFNDNEFKMAGDQFHFQYNISTREDLRDLLERRVEDVLSYYGIAPKDVNYVQLICKRLNRTLVTRYRVIKGSQRSDILSFLNRNYNKKVVIPVSISEIYLGKPLITKTKEGNIIAAIYEWQGKIHNLLDNNNTKTQFSADAGWNFYKVNINNEPSALAVRIVNDTTVHKVRFKIPDNRIEEILTDTLMPDNAIKRQIGNNKVMYMRGDRVYKTEQKVYTPPLEHKNKKIKGKGVANPNVGAIDCETCKVGDDEVLSKIYAAGFRTNLDAKPVLFYVEENRDYDKVIIDMFDELLRSKYEGITFYIHNLGGYDSIFLLKVLNDYNHLNKGNLNFEPYGINVNFRDTRIMNLTVSRKIGGSTHKVRLVDSFLMFNQKLSSLCEAFQIPTRKTIFPYKFSTERNLFYIGNTPQIDEYPGINIGEYNRLISPVWSFKEETEIYLRNDINALYEVVEAANKRIYRDFGVQMTDSKTISSLAMDVYMENYYKGNIPKISRTSLHNDIKNAYYGGITEVYRPYGENLYYYDVNSLYPHAALGDMPGNSCVKIEYLGTQLTMDQELRDRFGFFYCEVEGGIENNLYLGLLPYRKITRYKDLSNITSVDLIHPVGKWRGWYFSEELRYAIECGYRVRILEGYEFNRTKDVFKDFVENTYEMKRTAENKVQRSMAKSVLNNLFGRFGIGIHKGKTEIVSGEKYDEILSTRTLTSHAELDHDFKLVSYSHFLNHDIIKSLGWDITEILNSGGKDEEKVDTRYTSNVISAAVNSYARVLMCKAKMEVLKAGGNIYYSDTDSIVTDIPLPQHMVSPDELGKFKLEHEVEKGIFISNKTYCLVTKDGDFIARAKGVKTGYMTLNQFEALLRNENVSVLKRSSIKDWKAGSVEIKDSIITLYYNAYKKRDKVRDNKGTWIDTRPIIINEIDLALVPYKPHIAVHPQDEGFSFEGRIYYTSLIDPQFKRSLVIPLFNSSKDSDFSLVYSMFINSPVIKTIKIKLKSGTESLRAMWKEDNNSWFINVFIGFILGFSICAWLFSQAEDDMDIALDSSLDVTENNEVTSKELFEKLFGSQYRGVQRIGEEIPSYYDIQDDSLTQTFHKSMLQCLEPVSNFFDSYCNPYSEKYQERLVEKEGNGLVEMGLRDIVNQVASNGNRAFGNIAEREYHMYQVMAPNLAGRSDIVLEVVSDKIMELRYNIEFNELTVRDTMPPLSYGELRTHPVDSWMASSSDVSSKSSLDDKDSDSKVPISELPAVKEAWLLHKLKNYNGLNEDKSLAKDYILDSQSKRMSGESSELYSPEIRKIFGKEGLDRHVEEYSPTTTSYSESLKDSITKLETDSKASFDDPLPFPNEGDLEEFIKKDYNTTKQLSQDNKSHYYDSIEKTTEGAKPWVPWWKQGERPLKSIESEESLMEKGESLKIIEGIKQARRQEVYDIDRPIMNRFRWLLGGGSSTGKRGYHTLNSPDKMRVTMTNGYSLTEQSIHPKEILPRLGDKLIPITFMVKIEIEKVYTLYLKVGSYYNSNFKEMYFKFHVIFEIVDQDIINHCIENIYGVMRWVGLNNGLPEDHIDIKVKIIELKDERYLEDGIQAVKDISILGKCWYSTSCRNKLTSDEAKDEAEEQENEDNEEYEGHDPEWIVGETHYDVYNRYPQYYEVQCKDIKWNEVIPALDGDYELSITQAKADINYTLYLRVSRYSDPSIIQGLWKYNIRLHISEYEIKCLLAQDLNDQITINYGFLFGDAHYSDYLWECKLIETKDIKFLAEICQANVCNEADFLKESKELIDNLTREGLEYVTWYDYHEMHEMIYSNLVLNAMQPRTEYEIIVYVYKEGLRLKYHRSFITLRDRWDQDDLRLHFSLDEINKENRLFNQAMIILTKKDNMSNRWMWLFMKITRYKIMHLYNLIRAYWDHYNKPLSFKIPETNLSYKSTAKISSDKRSYSTKKVLDKYTVKLDNIQWNEEIPLIDTPIDKVLDDIDINTEYTLYIRSGRKSDINVLDGLCKLKIKFRLIKGAKTNCLEDIKDIVYWELNLNEVSHNDLCITGKLIPSNKEVINKYEKPQCPIVKELLSLKENVQKETTINFVNDMKPIQSYILFEKGLESIITDVIINMRPCKEYKIIVQVYNMGLIVMYNKSFICEQHLSKITENRIHVDLKELCDRNKNCDYMVLMLARIDDQLPKENDISNKTIAKIPSGKRSYSTSNIKRIGFNNNIVSKDLSQDKPSRIGFNSILDTRSKFQFEYTNTRMGFEVRNIYNYTKLMCKDESGYHSSIGFNCELGYIEVRDLAFNEVFHTEGLIRRWFQGHEITESIWSSMIDLCSLGINYILYVLVYKKDITSRGKYKDKRKTLVLKKIRFRLTSENRETISLDMYYKIWTIVWDDDKNLEFSISIIEEDNITIKNVMLESHEDVNTKQSLSLIVTKKLETVNYETIEEMFKDITPHYTTRITVTLHDQSQQEHRFQKWLVLTKKLNPEQLSILNTEIKFIQKSAFTALNAPKDKYGYNLIPVSITISQ